MLLLTSPLSSPLLSQFYPCVSYPCTLNVFKSTIQLIFYLRDKNHFMIFQQDGRHFVQSQYRRRLITCCWCYNRFNYQFCHPPLISTNQCCRRLRHRHRHYHHHHHLLVIVLWKYLMLKKRRSMEYWRCWNRRLENYNLVHGFI
jgi:hypothetical protein